jgi:UDP-N-acetylglucosamine 2-epimerase (non-hydrolysing)
MMNHLPEKGVRRRKSFFSIVLGTRPEIIKQFPIIRELGSQGRSYFHHTGQHYTRELDAVFLEGLNLPPPKCALG